MKHSSRYSPELRERAVRLVLDPQGGHETQWAAIVSVSSKVGCSAETLRKWVRQAERDQGRRPGLTSDERERLKALERENLELRRANEILRKSVGVFRPGGARPPTQELTSFIDAIAALAEAGADPQCATARTYGNASASGGQCGQARRDCRPGQGGSRPEHA